MSETLGGVHASLVHSSSALDPPNTPPGTEPTCPAQESRSTDRFTHSLVDQIQTWTLLHPSVAKQTPDIKVLDWVFFLFNLS